MSLSRRTSTGDSSSSSLYDYVAGRLIAILPAFGLQQYLADILQSYQIIFEEQLCEAPRGALQQSSSLNYDGTPIQFALALGLDAVQLQFLGETGRPSLADAERVKAGRRSISSLSAVLQVEKQLEQVLDLIDRSCKVNTLDLNPDHGGIFWIGAGFSSDGKAALKIYINGKRGREVERWARFRQVRRPLRCFPKLARY